MSAAWTASRRSHGLGTGHPRARQGSHQLVARLRRGLAVQAAAGVLACELGTAWELLQCPLMEVGWWLPPKGVRPGATEEGTLVLSLRDGLELDKQMAVKNVLAGGRTLAQVQILALT